MNSRKTVLVTVIASILAGKIENSLSDPVNLKMRRRLSRNGNKVELVDMLTVKFSRFIDIHFEETEAVGLKKKIGSFFDNLIEKY